MLKNVKLSSFFIEVMDFLEFGARPLPAFTPVFLGPGLECFEPGGADLGKKVIAVMYQVPVKKSITVIALTVTVILIEAEAVILPG